VTCQEFRAAMLNVDPLTSTRAFVAAVLGHKRRCPRCRGWMAKKAKTHLGKLTPAERASCRVVSAGVLADPEAMRAVLGESETP
jgi:hypothetical protein